MSDLLDVALSREIAKRIQSKANQCFNNAYKAALLMKESIYVQGFLVYAAQPSVLTESAWIELDNRIVDPTFPHLNIKTQELYYFPAQRLSVPQLIATVEEAKEDYPEDDPLPVYGTAPYEYYGEVMLGGADYMAAYKEAEAKYRALNNKML